MLDGQKKKNISSADKLILAAHDIGGGRNFADYADLQNKWDNTSVKVGLTYDLNNDSIVYASYTEGFHSGGYYAVVQNTSNMRQNAYDPEFSESIEIGYKALLMNKRVQLNMNYFLNDFMNKQEESTQQDPNNKNSCFFLVKCC